MLKSSLLAFITLFTVAAAAPTNTTGSDIFCPPAIDSISLRRMWSGGLTSHFYSTYGPEVPPYEPSSYVEEAPQGRIYPDQYDGTAPFWRCVNNQGTTQVDYVYTADAGEWRALVASGCQVIPDPSQAGIAEGIGYIYTSQVCGSIPLYRLYSTPRSEHLYTIDAGERQADIASGVYVDQGIAGYVLPN